MLKIPLCAFALTLFSLFVMSACGQPKKREKAVSQPEKSEVAQQITHVYFYDDFPQKVGKRAVLDLAKILPDVQLEEKLPLPDTAYYKPRNRYLATVLLDGQLTLKPKGDLVLGITDKDISLKYKHYDNWGVMGLSYQGNEVAVVSTFRLGGVEKMDRRDFLKLILHELGHTEGLPHCAEGRSCIMRDAEGKNNFPQLTSFCPSCKKFLEGKGWKLP
ncbi:MAG: Zn-dependent protease [Bacteroidetes bacterium]|nr:Zn-dependent protease [Bacteroidota bacterium]